MKKTLGFIITLFLILNISQAQDTMYVHRNGGLITKIAVSKIDSIVFYATATNPSLSYAELWEYNPTTDSWSKKSSDYVVKRDNAVAFSIGQKGYFGTGNVAFSGTKYTKDFWEFDLSSNKWTKMTDFGGAARGMATGFSIGATGYVGLGNVATNDFWAYSPSQNSWTQKAFVGPARRCLAVSFCIGGKGYISTGGISPYLKDMLEYDPTINSWNSKTDFPGVGRWGALGFAIGNKGYVGGGADASSNFPKDFYEYDPSNNTWTKKADLPVILYCQPCFVIGTKGYFIAYSDVYQYDQSTDIWTKMNRFPFYSTESYAFTLNGNAYLLVFPSTAKGASSESVEDRLKRDLMLMNRK
jgi:N-acetylneuraminic acid mutarotase